VAFERVKQFKDLTLRYQSAQTLTVQVYVNGSAAPSRTLSYPASATPANYTEPLDVTGLLEGTLIRFRFESAGIVRLLAGKVRARPIGTYFDGANNEVWETTDLGLGI